MILEYNFLLALFFTIVIEVFVLLFVVRKFFRIKEKKLSLGLLLVTGFFASFATLPYVWFIFPSLLKTYYLYMLGAELFALFAEAAIYYFILRLNFKQAFILSLACNLVSFLIGLLFFS